MFFRGGKAAGAWSFSSVEVKSEWSYTATALLYLYDRTQLPTALTQVHCAADGDVGGACAGGLFDPVLWTRTTAVQFGALTLLSHCILCLPINRRAHSNQQTILFIATDTKPCRPRSKVVLEKLLVALLLKKSLALYGTHSYTCVHPAYHFNIILPSVCLPFRFP